MNSDLCLIIYKYLHNQNASKAAKYFKKFAELKNDQIKNLDDVEDLEKLVELAMKSKKNNATKDTPPSSPKHETNDDTINDELPIKTKKRKADKEASNVQKKENVPFQRVKKDEVEFLDERLKDNTYMKNIGDSNDYGYKAHLDLIVTKGKGFRTEKNKKKRGSYRGGAINVSDSNSIKFQYSEDDE